MEQCLLEILIWFGAVPYSSSYVTATKANWTDGYLTYKAAIPAQYQRVEYIQSSGAQYIDSQYKPTPNTGVKAVYEFTSITPTQQRIFGVLGLNSDSQSLTYTFYINSSSILAYGYKNGTGNWATTSISANTNKHTLLFNTGKGNILHDTTSKTLSGTATNTARYNMIIFASTNEGLSTINYKANLKIYEFDIYENGVLVKRFIPCYRKSDSVKGLYDNVNNVFYTNADTSGVDFTPGSSLLP